MSLSTATSAPVYLREVQKAFDAAPAPEAPVRVSVHDAARFEWQVVVPLPEHGKMAYSIEVELEVPTNAVARSTPWDQLQTLTRFDGAAFLHTEDDATLDTLRRAAASLTALLRQARVGFERHCRERARGAPLPADQGAPSFLGIWLETGIRVAREARAKLTQATSLDSAPVARERGLIDEFVSVALLEMLSDADRVLLKVAAEVPPTAPEADEFAALRRVLDEALRAEVEYRRSRAFLSVDASSPAALERYVARMAVLKKHFEEVMFLDRETRLVDERVQRWLTVVAAALAGALAVVLQLLLGARVPGAVHMGSGVVAFALVGGIAYATRDRVKEAVRAWLTGKAYRYHAQRVSRCRIPERRNPARDVVVRAREWCNQTTRSAPDPLSPESGATLRRTLVDYVHHGVVSAHEALARSGVTRIRHVFRYDLSPLFPRLHDETKRVPVVERDGSVRIVDAPRRYYVPIRVRVGYDEHSWEERVTVVVDKRGIRRVDRGVEPSGADPASL